MGGDGGCGGGGGEHTAEDENKWKRSEEWKADRLQAFTEVPVPKDLCVCRCMGAVSCSRPPKRSKTTPGKWDRQSVVGNKMQEQHTSATSIVLGQVFTDWAAQHTPSSICHVCSAYTFDSSSPSWTILYGNIFQMRNIWRFLISQFLLPMCVDFFLLEINEKEKKNAI